MTGTAPTRAPGSRLAARFETALVVGGFLVLFFFLPHDLLGDAKTRLPDVEELLHHGRLSDSKYSLVMPLFSSPFLLVGELVGSPEWWATRFNVIVVAGGAAAAFRLLRGRVSPAVLRKTVLVLLFASLLTNMLREFGPEIFTATFVAVGIVVLATGGSPVAGWGAIVVGVVNTPGALVALALVAVAETIRTKRLRMMAPVLVAATLIATENWVRRGGPLVTGYEHDAGFATVLPYSGRSGFSYPFVLGVASILFSFGRGLTFFTPGLTLWLSSHTRRLAREWWHAVVLMLLFVAGLVLLYAKWWSWYGGLSWGPRFFVFATVPASLAIVLRLVDTRASAAGDGLTLLVFALSAWVGLDGVISDREVSHFCAENNYALESMCWYVPEFSALWRPFRETPSITPATAIVVAWWTVVILWLGVPLVARLAHALPRLAPGRSGWRI